MPCGRSADRCAVAAFRQFIPANKQGLPANKTDDGAAMMILRSSPSSPFGRKVRIAISLVGLDNDVKIEAADTTDANDSVRQQNPLGKIPVLIAEDGVAYYDSRVILDYLDHRSGGGKIVPREAVALRPGVGLPRLVGGGTGAPA